jgi:hypothetical protein
MGKFLTVLVAALLGHQSLALKSLRFASPLQSFTIPDPDAKETKSSRQKFLPKFKAGLVAETATRRKIAAKRTKEVQKSVASGDDWAEKVAAEDIRRREMEERIVEKTFDEATAKYDSSIKETPGSSTKSPNSYQFVAVINRNQDKKPITWYARKKPADAKWSVRAVHVNRDAIIKDLFNRGKVDIFAKYRNTGTVDEETKTPIIMNKYSVRKRSWK